MSNRKDHGSVSRRGVSRSSLLLGVGVGALGLTAYSAGCSVPDRTYYNDSAGIGGLAPNAGTGGTERGGSGGRKGNNGGAAGVAGAAGEDAGGEAGESSAGQSNGGGGQPGDVRPVPTKGLIVIGGTTIDQTKGIISVIAPATGKELSRTALPANTQIAEIAYDGAAGKDVWYSFTGTAFPAKEDKVLDMQVRYFNDTTNKWITLSTLSPVPPPVPGTITVLNDRLAYLSHVVSGSTVTPALTILDTSDVKAIKVIANSYMPATPFAGDMLTLIGTRGTASDATGIGGTLDLGLKQNCAAGVCDLFVQPIPIGDSIGTALGHVLGRFKGKPIAYASQLEQLDYFALSPATGSVQVYRATPNAPEAADNFNAPQSADDLSAMTVAACQNTALVSADAENALYGVTLGAGAGKDLDLGRAGQLVVYDPFTRTAITTYNPTTNDFETAAADAGVPGPDITAVEITSTGGVTLKLATRTTGWTPPTDVRANLLVARFPVPYTCP